MTIISQNASISPNVYIKQEDGIMKYASNTVSWSELSDSDFPVTIVNTAPITPLTIHLKTSLVMNGVDKYFKIGSHNITIIGHRDHNISIADTTNYNGLIQNGTMDFSGYDNITVKYIQIVSSNSGLGETAGWICQRYFGKGSLNNKIEYCTNWCDINGNGGGGICGQYAGSSSGTCIINACTSHGNVIGVNASGICGSFSGNNGKCEITNCSNSGELSGESTSGICGDNAGSNNGICEITVCYNKGELSGESTSGICGDNAGSNNGSCTLTNCYTLYGSLSSTSPSSNFSITSSYTAGGIWSAVSAKQFLTGYSPNFEPYGEVWVSIQNDPWESRIFYDDPQPTTINQNASAHGNLYISQFEDGTMKYSSDKNNNLSWMPILMFPVIIVNTTTDTTTNPILTVYFEKNLTITNDYLNINTSSKYFICGSEYITFDGKFNDVTIIDVNNHPGLIQNGTGDSVGYSNITVKNININSSGTSSLAEHTGWICQSYFGSQSINNKIENCSNSCDINVVGGGGICGSVLASNSGNCEITNCYNEGVVSGYGAGGICGSSAGSYGFCTLTNCYNIGDLSDEYTSGICGGSAGGVYNIGSCTLTNCYTLYGPFSVTSEHDGFSITNSYAANGVWSDLNANEVLTGDPLDSTLEARVWVSEGADTPYKLMSFYVVDVPISSICFLGDSLITTDQGECRIDEIDVTYHTLDGKPILKITQTRSIDNHLVSFGKDSLGLNIPSRCTVMTKGHSLLYNGELIQARNFLNVFDNVSEVPYNNEIVYNVLMESACTMKVNNLICETLNPRHFMGNLLIYLDGLNKSERNDLLLCYNDYLKVNKCLPNALYYDNGRHIFAGLKSS